MKQMRRAAIYKLAASAHEMELDVMNGILRRDDDGRWHNGGYDLLGWVDAHHGEEIGSLANGKDGLGGNQGDTWLTEARGPGQGVRNLAGPKP